MPQNFFPHYRSMDPVDSCKIGTIIMTIDLFLLSFDWQQLQF